jgi:predicted  nucleic acid-binding Zn-ribbon protein
MSSNPFYAFIELVQFDQKLNESHKEIKDLQSQIESLQKEQLFLAKQLTQAQDQYRHMKKEVDEKELEMKVLDDMEAAKKKLLEQTSDHKIYQVIKSEIASIKRKQHGLEEQLVKVWNAAENAQKDWQSKVKNQEEKSKEISQSIDRLEKEIAAKKEFIRVESVKRDQLEKPTPTDWIEKYNMMKSRVTNPVVPAVHGICTVCFYKVSDQDMIRMADQELVQCKDCFRLLYLPEIMEEVQTQDQV